MSTLGYVLSSFFLIFVLFSIFALFLRINLNLSFNKQQMQKMKYDLTVSFFGRKIERKIKIPQKEKKTDQNSEKSKLTFEEKIKKHYSFFKVVKATWKKSKWKVRKRILLKKCCLCVTFGTGDAAQTGIATGILWTIIYDVIAFISNFIRVTKPDVSVNPIYDEEELEVHGECILTLSLANIISILTIISLNYFLQRRKLTKKEKAAIKNVNSN